MSEQHDWHLDQPIRQVLSTPGFKDIIVNKPQVSNSSGATLTRKGIARESAELLFLYNYGDI